MRHEAYTHPLNIHFRKTSGSNIRGMARLWGFKPQTFYNVVYNGWYNKDIVDKLRKEGVYELLTEEVKEKLEKRENGNAE